MAHITITNELPGIGGLLKQFPQTGRPLAQLAEVLLRGPSGLSSGEREMIAAFVSSRNGCTFCMNSHGAAARVLLGEDAGLLDQVVADLDTAPVNPKMRALLTIAARVQEGGKQVSEDDIARARTAGADDQDLHDTVLIAAAFCMYNRYVDGLGTWAAQDPADYDEYGVILAEQGYMRKR